MRNGTIAALLALAGCSGAEAREDARQPRGAMPAGSGAAAAKAAPGSAAEGMQTVEVIDRMGMGQPMVAGRATVPSSWRTEGGVNWDGSTGCATNQMKFQWRAVAPDGVEALELMPGFGWQMPSAAIPMNPCPVAGIASAQQFLQAVAQSMRPNARIAGYRQRTDLEAEARGYDRNGYQTQVGELRLAYDLAGRPVEELLLAAVSLSGSGGTTGYVTAYRTAAGQMDMARADRIRRSFKGNPEYAQAIGQRGMDAVRRFSDQQSAAISSWHNARMAEINAKGASDRAAIRARGNAETNAIYAQTAAGTAAANDRIHDSNVRAIREEQTWTGPSGQTVQGSIHGGQRVLEMPGGSFVRTDDPYYNPAGSTEYSPD